MRLNAKVVFLCVVTISVTLFLKYRCTSVKTQTIFVESQSDISVDENIPLLDAAQKKARICLYNDTPTNLKVVEKTMKYSKGQLFLYIYPKGIDLLSDDYHRGIPFEAEPISEMEKLFDQDPDLHLIDIGSNIGLYTLVAAMRGRKVVAVDPNMENIKISRHALLRNKVENNVILVCNGVSNIYSEFTLRADSTNIGDTHFIKPTNRSVVLIKSIYMDDLLSLINFKKAVLKMDIENHEFEALHKAGKFFKEMNIPYIFLEYGMVKPFPSRAKWIINFLHKRSYIPFASMFAKKPLDVNNIASWPWDTAWRKSV